MTRPAGVFLLAGIMLSVAFAAPVPPGTQLRPYEYTWHPETSPQGPVLVVISLPEQQAYVYRNGLLIGRTTIRSGRAGHRTRMTELMKSKRHPELEASGAGYHAKRDAGVCV